MYLISKRILDFTLAAIVLLLISPIFLLIIILLRLTAEKEVFYFQTRMGKDNEPFQIWKFATMLKNSENMGTGTITVRKDPRVTAVGSVLRITKINELPQLINVLRGEMSIVGPRPLALKDFEHYSPEIQKVIYKSKPGLTGIGSIIFRDEQELVSNSELEPITFYKRYIIPYKGELERWYYQNASFGNDLLIIGLTAWVLLFSKSKLVYKIFPGLPKKPSELDSQAAV